MMKNKLKSVYTGKELLPFSVIMEASNGDVEAINDVLKYYEPYICKLSLRLIYDEAGNSYVVVDEYMRRRLETKLITKLLDFKAA